MYFFRSGFAGTANFFRRKAVKKLFFGRRLYVI
jgi:ferritin